MAELWTINLSTREMKPWALSATRSSNLLRVYLLDVQQWITEKPGYPNPPVNVSLLFKDSLWRTFLIHVLFLWHMMLLMYVHRGLIDCNKITDCRIAISSGDISRCTLCQQHPDIWQDKCVFNVHNFTTAMVVSGEIRHCLMTSGIMYDRHLQRKKMFKWEK